MRQLSTADNVDTEGLTMQIVRAIALLMMGLAACGQAGNDPPSSATCVIDGTTFQDGEAAPNAPCLRCRVATSPTSWTAEPAETACDDGSGCTSDDKCSPAGECRGSAATLGTACDAGVCDSEGACQRACLIDNTLIPADGAKPSDRCLVCEPSTSTSSWTRVTDACAQCGNSTVEAGEECDDGNIIDTDNCTNKCKNPVCGDSIASTGEECDDGNAVGTDGCVACKVARCGDGSVQAGLEDCDDANTIDNDACPNSCAIGRCPDGMIYIRPTPDGPGSNLAPYCIDKMEVSASELPANPSKCQASNLQGYGGNKPAICVTFAMAISYCISLQKRLPTDAEWVYAAQGDDGRTYPWGNDPPTCSHATYAPGPNRFCGGTVAAQPWNTPPLTTPVGSLPTGSSPFGALDMAGNVREWVDTGKLRGGGFLDDDLGIMITKVHTTSNLFGNDVGYQYEGLRCASDPLR